MAVCLMCLHRHVCIIMFDEYSSEGSSKSYAEVGYQRYTQERRPFAYSPSGLSVTRHP